MKTPSDINCEDARAWIDLAVTGDLPQEERGALDSHLAVCQECARRFATRQALWEYYPAGIFPTEGLIARTLARAGKRRVKRLAWNATPLRTAVATLAAAALLVFTVTLYFRHFGKEAGSEGELAAAPVVAGGEIGNGEVLQHILAALDGKTQETVSIDVGNNVKILVVPRRGEDEEGNASYPEADTPSNARLADWVY
ncbi:MAG: zf-HC2 domain-containing protein [Planctomycetota bacterium]